ncbi:hypothetical protein BC939DRAFT_439409 [Gamsiella multidivaricata]|uniref:uncharacterized protein n=1 Tax=Gamsiella multidivaricata TaxID=101098 RepID=UPI002220DB41|nr:uncharacterized protein BC939DRAFT_439409 [Gamsiella multidivaricata]KAI7830460.1 hypothetical protein BC939DRAFT_439409 [Gamsiella multidivaricata]
MGSRDIGRRRTARIGRGYHGGSLLLILGGSSFGGASCLSSKFRLRHPTGFARDGARHVIGVVGIIGIVGGLVWIARVLRTIGNVGFRG